MKGFLVDDREKGSLRMQWTRSRGKKKDVIVIKGCPIKRVLCVLGRESNQLGTHKWRRGSRTSGGGGYTIRPSIWKGRENNGRRKITQRHEYLNDGATFFSSSMPIVKGKKRIWEKLFWVCLSVLWTCFYRQVLLILVVDPAGRPWKRGPIS